MVLVILQRQVLQSCFDPGLVPQLQFIDRVDSVRDGVLPVLSSAVNRDRYPQLLCFSAWVSGLLQYFDKVVDVPAEACGKMSHNFFVLLALFAWNLDLISSSPLFCQPLAPVRCDSPRRLLTKFFQFPREKWTPITLQFTLGNLELFLRPVSGSHRVRQSTLLLEEFHIFSSCWLSRLPCAVRSSRRCSDQHDTFSGVGILADPVSAGLRAGDLVSRSSRSSTRLGRRALRAARRVQVSENSFCCTDSFARSFVPHRRVVSSTSDLARASVPRVSGELSASCSCCGRALVCESGALYRVCAEDARQSVVSSGGDHFDRNSWKHGHEAAS